MGRKFVRWSDWAALVAATLSLIGCGGTLVRDKLVHSYMGIPFDASKTSPDIAALAQRSLGGDKQAQLDLGIAFEEGRGVGLDLEKALRLYKLAASDSGPIVVYVPGVSGGSGHLARVSVGGDLRGLPEAQVRVDQMGKRRLRSSEAPDPMMPGGSKKTSTLCHLVASLVSQSPSSQQQFVPLLKRELRNGDAGIVPLQWSQQAINTIFTDTPVSADNSLSYQVFLISTPGGCDVSEQIKDDALSASRISDGERALAVRAPAVQDEIFDVIPLKLRGDGYSVVINFKKGSRTVLDVFALIWE